MENSSEYGSSVFKVYNARWKQVGYLLSFLALGGLFFWVGVLGYPLSFLGSAFFGLGFLLTIPKLFDSSPQIIIDSEGIKDYRRQYWPNSVTIPWKDIESIRLLRRVSGRYGRRTYIVGIKFKNPQHYYQQKAPIHRWSQKLDPAADYEIGGTGLTASGIDVFSYISAQQQAGRISVSIVDGS